MVFAATTTLPTASSSTKPDFHSSHTLAEAGFTEETSLSSQRPPLSVIIIPKFLKQQQQHEDHRWASTSTSSDACSTTDDTASLISFVSNYAEPSIVCGVKLRLWNGKSLFSDLIHEGLRYQQRKCGNVVMLFEGPSSASSSSSSEHQFYNSQVYKFHDYPRAPVPCKAVLGPCRYALMNGATYPSYLRDAPPEGLLAHWKSTVPGFKEPSFVSTINDSSLVYAYLPMEHVQQHLNDPHIHYHLAGKDAIGLMTQKTTPRLSNTRDKRPCVCKISHSMGSRGVYLIRNDEDEAQFNAFLTKTGNPPFIITDYVEVVRQVSGHFFLHPQGEITWFGSSETCRRNGSGADGGGRGGADGGDQWGLDSTLVMSDQEHLRAALLPFVKDVIHYFQALGFWGLCGVDVVWDSKGKGFLVEVNPRVTGSCPFIMVAHLLREKYGFDYGVFRHSSRYAFPGTASELLHQTKDFNQEHQGKFLVVVYSFHEVNPSQTLVNMGVHGGTSLSYCESILDSFASPISIL